ncbi:MAG: biopolymer transport protein ExbD [Candidatus Pelagisphaera sp.]|jgi:biopolymer transport protein ExbD
MAPMIDMVFLLLVFFMTVSSMSQAGHRVELELPESTSGETPKDLSNRVMLSVQKDGTFYLGGELVLAERLGSRLLSMHNQFPEMKLRIRADRGTAFSDVKKAMTAATEAGISDYLYGTLQGE